MLERLLRGHPVHHHQSTPLHWQHRLVVGIPRVRGTYHIGNPQSQTLVVEKLPTRKQHRETTGDDALVKVWRKLGQFGACLTACRVFPFRLTCEDDESLTSSTDALQYCEPLIVTGLTGQCGIKALGPLRRHISHWPSTHCCLSKRHLRSIPSNMSMSTFKVKVTGLVPPRSTLPPATVPISYLARLHRGIRGK